MEYQNIGDNVYRFRIMKQMTQEELAELANVSSTYISQIERANLHKSVTCQTLFNIAKALNVPVCLLMAEETCETYFECMKRIADERPEVKRAAKTEPDINPEKKSAETPFDNLFEKDDELF